ncbi:hypothetical protein D3C81_1790020 [compost metagenome]
MQVVGQLVYRHLALLRQVGDRADQRILHAGQPDQAAKAVPHRQQPRGERQQAIDEVSELAVRAIGQASRMRDCQGLVCRSRSHRRIVRLACNASFVPNSTKLAARPAVLPGPTFYANALPV